MKNLVDAGSVLDETDLDARHGVVFSTVAAMKALNPTDINGNTISLSSGLTVITQGYATAGDGGGGQYLIAGNQTVDGFGDHPLANNNVALLQKLDVTNAKQYGATGDGSTDDAPALQAAIDSLDTGGVLFMPLGTYSIASTLTVNTAGVTMRGVGGDQGRTALSLIHI